MLKLYIPNLYVHSFYIFILYILSLTYKLHYLNTQPYIRRLSEYFKNLDIFAYPTQIYICRSIEYYKYHTLHIPYPLYFTYTLLYLKSPELHTIICIPYPTLHIPHIPYVNLNIISYIPTPTYICNIK